VITDQSFQEYQPELVSRRGEALAWVSTLLVALGIIILILSGQGLSWLVVLLQVILLVSAAIISLGNWSDRKTVLRLTDHGIDFRNGLRRVQLNWSEVKEVRATPSPWGKKVQVYGEKNHFSFRTLAEVTVRGELKGRFGFVRGEEILREIVLRSNLEIMDDIGVGYYYVRK